MWFYMDRILIPYQISDAATHDLPRGYLSDLYPRWLGARELLLYGRDPYSAEVTRNIQAGYYGRPLDPARPSDPKDQQAFAYPVYVVFLLAPTVHLPFSVVEKSFYDFLWLLSIASVFLWLYALRWPLSLPKRILLVVLVLGSVPVVYGLKVQQLSLVVAMLLAASMAALVSEQLVLSGICLGIATIKPQLAWLPAVWLLAWAIRRWKYRQRFVWAFGVTLATLLAASEFILPGWLKEFYIAVQNYRQYTHNVSALAWLTTPLVGAIASIFLIVGVAFWCCRHLNDEPDSRNFQITLCLVLTTTVIVVPMFAPYNQILLLPAILFLARETVQLWNGARILRIIFIVAAGLLSWPWMASLGMMIAAAFLPRTALQSAWRLPLYNSFSFPIMLFLLLAYGVPAFQNR